MIARIEVFEDGEGPVIAVRQGAKHRERFLRCSCATLLFRQQVACKGLASD